LPIRRLPAPALRLSGREREILQPAAKGKSAKEAVFLLNILVKTVGFHRENIKRSPGIGTTAELTKYALGRGLV
jgi:DNA-binding CsgD family transcriptional regulator